MQERRRPAGSSRSSPTDMGVCVWSPPLDETGNSLGGRVALHHLAERLDLSIF